MFDRNKLCSDISWLLQKTSSGNIITPTSFSVTFNTLGYVLQLIAGRGILSI